MTAKSGLDMRKRIRDMDYDDLASLVEVIHMTLWPGTGPADDVSWDPDTLDKIAEIFGDADLHPGYGD